ncbi:MAG: hypothetical protein ACREP9_11060, partial [Candidatus Dormibacteraceae bacterium]
GLQTNGFSFIISWAPNSSVLIQVCTNLSSSTWLPLQTNTLTGGFAYFNDPRWTDFSIRFYRVASTVEPIVFSSNVVGYVTTSVIGGGPNGKLQMIANPLDTTNNTIGFLIPSAPDWTVVYKYDGGVFLIATYFLGAWDHPEYSLNPGEGAIVWSPSQWSNTFVGEVLQGALSNPYPTGFSIRASQVPQAGTLTELGWSNSQVSFGDTVFLFSTTNQSYYSSVFLGSWSPDLIIAVGESFWLQTSSPGTWTRFFSVQ